jgi:hypothetical protein
MASSYDFWLTKVANLMVGREKMATGYSENRVYACSVDCLSNHLATF